MEFVPSAAWNSLNGHLFAALDIFFAQNNLNEGHILGMYGSYVCVWEINKNLCQVLKNPLILFSISTINVLDST